MRLTKLKPTLLTLLGLALAGLTGCMSTQALDSRIQQIKRKHNVTVRAENPLSRCYLFGYLPGLLDRIDRDLDSCPQYFKENIGPVIIEENFADNFLRKPALLPFSAFIAGYVDETEAGERFPIHIKNRSLLERALFILPREGEKSLHEATHSFEILYRI